MRLALKGRDPFCLAVSPAKQKMLSLRPRRLCGENSILDKHDIHGNLPALEAAVADATSPGDSKIVRAGDRIAYGPFPSEVCRREALAAERAAEGFLREDKVRFLH